MKTNVLGIRSKYFLALPFVLFLFANYGNGQVIPDADEADTDKEPVACEYLSEEIKIYGNSDCSNMFCAAWGTAECTYKTGKNKKVSILCSADQNPDGSWTCPGAYACALDEDHEYHAAFVTGGNLILNSACEGAGVLNMTSGVLGPFPILKEPSLTPIEVTPEDTPPTVSNPRPPEVTPPEEFDPDLAPNPPSSGN